MVQLPSNLIASSTEISNSLFSSFSPFLTLVLGILLFSVIVFFLIDLFK